MDQEQVRLFLQQNFYYIILGQIMFGLIVGSIPYLLSRRRNKQSLGLVGLLLSVIFSTVSPLLGLLVAAIFSILVLRKTDPNDHSNAEVSNDNSDTPHSDHQ
jgi:ABC-type transport system involved in multi-copper enzyme maturation permease subunit